MKSKPMAMQTLMDEMVKEFIIALTLLIFATDLELVGFEPASKEMAFTIVLLKFVFGQYFFMQVLIVTVIRYLIIFHGPLIGLIIDRCCISMYSGIF